jgi:hypothetical protein
MDSKQYELRRNELLTLINQVIEIGVPEPHARELAGIHRKCLEDQFEVALVGAFQGGKSTTFNALCDGREISPRGLNGGGVKTSAGIVTAQHLADPNKFEEGLDGEVLSEWAEVTWRDEREILLGMAELVIPHLAEDKEFALIQTGRLESRRIGFASTSEHLSTILSLENNDDRAALVRAIDLEWRSWANNKGAYPGDNFDLLCISSLHLHFWANKPDFEEQRARRIFSIAEIQQCVVFPIDWLQRWTVGRAACEGFSVTEATFAFVSRVLLRLRSKNLARLGCRVTDCPGLFVSAWDTRLAMEVMHRADAIWFLIGGDKAVDGEVKAILNYIRDHGWQHKLRLTVNLKGGNSHQQMIGRVLPATRAALEQMGLGDIQVHPYDAFLAFRALQGGLLMKGREHLSKQDLHCLAEEYRVPVEMLDPAKAWRKFVNRRLATAEIELSKILLEDDPTSESVEEVRRHSYLDEIMSAIELMVIERKARSILLSNGARPAEVALARLEGDLKAREQQASKKVEEFLRKYDDLKERLDLFLSDANDAIEPLREEAIDHALFENYWHEAVLPAANEAAAKAASKIHNDILTISNLGLILSPFSSVSKQSLSNQASALISREFESFLKQYSLRWKERLCDGNLETFQTKVAKRAEIICSKIRSRWDQHLPANILNEQHLLEGIQMPSVSGIPKNDAAEIARENGVRNASEIIVTENIFNPGLVGGLVGALVGGVLSLLITPVGWIALVSAAVVATVAASSSGLDRKNGIKKIFDKLKPGLDTSLHEKRKEIAESLIGDSITPFRVVYVNYLEGAIRHIDEVFKERCEVAQQDFQHSNEERILIAQCAKEQRIQKIVPARARLAEFCATVEPECSNLPLLLNF